MKVTRVACAVVLAGIVAALLSAFGPKPQFTPDGYDYAIMMLMDRGVPYVQAQAQAERFFDRQPVAHIPGIAPLLHEKPEYWNLFSVRRFDPWLASLLYPYRGFGALVDISRLSYILTAILTLLLAIRFVPLGYGLLVSIALALLPAWRDIARDALTDPLAIALTAAALLAASAILARRTVWRVLAFALLCGLLSFTRPIPYILLGAGIIAAIAAPREGDRSQLTSAALITGIAALWTAVLEIALAHVHAPSFRWIVEDTYRHFLLNGYAPAGESAREFFIHEEFTIALHVAYKGALSVVPVLAIVGIVLRRRNPATPLLAGACVATWFGALVDPNRFDIVRCVIMPVAPVVGSFAAAAIATVVAQVPAPMGLVAPSVRHFLPGRFFVRKATVKE